MLRGELLTVSPVIPTCSMYLRQLWRLAANRAGARYSQMKYFHKSNAAIAEKNKIHVTIDSANSAQMRRRTRLLRTGEGEHKKARRKTNGEKNSPKLSSKNAAKRLVHRGTLGWERGQNS